jgi:hypothetical protein
MVSTLGGIISEQLAEAVKITGNDVVEGDGELILIKRHGRNIHPGHILFEGEGLHPVSSSAESTTNACPSMHDLQDASGRIPIPDEDSDSTQK